MLRFSTNYMVPLFDLAEDSISATYYEQLERDNQGVFQAKVVGRFYTPSNVGALLAEDLLRDTENLEGSLSVIDPFCGDGSLLVAFLTEIERRVNDNLLGLKLHVKGFDIDQDAIEVARNKIAKFADASKNLIITTDIKACDSFMLQQDDLAADFCITNPPWLLLKAAGRLGSQGKREYVDLLNRRFPIATSKSSFGSKTANLARIGSLQSLNAVLPSGKSAILLPSSLMSDLESSDFRAYLWSNFQVQSVSFFDAKLKVFAGVDQDFVALVASANPDMSSADVELRHFSSVDTFEKINISRCDLNEVLGENFELADFKSKLGFSVFRSLKRFPKLDCHKGIRIFREVDETRIAERFDEKSNWLFIKGRNIDRYSRVTDELPRIPHPNGRSDPSTAKPKIVWRDVARRSQSRRIKATIIGPGILAGNSLGCIETCSDDSLYFYLGIMNSWLTELQVRALSHTNHISTGVVKRLFVPEWDASNQIHVDLSTAVASKMYDSKSIDQLDIEALVIKAFGLEHVKLNDLERLVLGQI
mgnify:CR=1 FL=1